MNQFLKLFPHLARGKTLVRALMDERLSRVMLSGTVLDVGGGKEAYLEFMPKEKLRGAQVINIDGKTRMPDGRVCDLEVDPLPREDGTVDQVLLLNVLEHVYDHRHVLSEIYRVLQSEGALVGFVPFLVQYHPDPHDYFRYTKEALARLLREQHFIDIEIIEVGGGPFFVNYNTLVLSVPRAIALILFPWYYILDRVFLALRPAARERYPLGYFFSATKG